MTVESNYAIATAMLVDGLKHPASVLQLIQARFTRQFFWHGTCLNLAPVPKIFGPAPSIFVV